MFQRSLVAILMLCLASVGLSGCASTYGKQTTKVELYPDCYEPIKTLRKEENRPVNSAVTGAAAAGFFTLATCAIINRDVSASCVGQAAVSAAAGATAGYFLGVQQKSRDENSRMAYYLQDIEGDISGLNIATASARMSIQCYQKKFDASLAQYKKKSISREQLEASYKEIKSGLDESQRILGKVIESAQESDARYMAAIQEEEKLASRSASFKQVKSKQASYKASIADAQKAQKSLDNFSARMAENMT